MAKSKCAHEGERAPEEWKLLYQTASTPSAAICCNNSAGGVQLG